MPTFTYKAVNETGQQVTGVVTAENHQVALRLLDEQTLFPIQVEEGTAVGTSKLTGGRRRVKLRYITVVYSQLADLLRAGVPMLRALDVLTRQNTHPVLTEILKEIREDVAGGKTLADAMEQHPRVFKPLHAAMVRAGERGGFLEDVLSRLSMFAERQDELRGKLIGSMIYPCVLLVVGAAVVTFLLAVVVPQLRDYIPAESYNFMTHVVFWATDVLRDHYLLIIGSVLAIVFGAYSAVRTEWGKTVWARFQLTAPVLGRVVTMVAVCRFCRILGTMLHNGVPILQAISISKESAGNKLLAEQVDKAGEAVRKGESLAAQLGASNLFPVDIIDMMAVAEESNNLENVLIQIADANETRTARQIDLGVRLLEPMLLLVMAVLVLCIAVALLLPILTMSQAAGMA
ncbi:MAG: type II secretion system F family protein [Phycisphaerales bacterium]|nr:MAG: type II secretion system F family protein [Phycisphaerales bacterium]